MKLRTPLVSVICLLSVSIWVTSAAADPVNLNSLTTEQQALINEHVYGGMADEKDLVTVVDRTALVENLLNQVIAYYCAPAKERFMLFWNVVLDSSVMTIGSKVKVSMAIAQELGFKLNQNAIHNVMVLRNAFAHHKTDSHPVLVAGKTQEEDSEHFELLIISNSGRISRKRRQDALGEFNTHYTEAKDALVSLLEIIKADKKSDTV